MKELYFIYDEYVITCILIGRKGMVYSKGMAIWDGSFVCSEVKGMEIAYKRAKRALKRDYYIDLSIKKEEALLKIAKADENMFAYKSVDIQQKYSAYLEDWISEDENKVLNFLFSDKSSEDFKREKVIVVRRKKIEKGYRIPEVNLYNDDELGKAVMDGTF